MAGYTQLDGKGRLTVGKPIREVLHLEAGSTLAWLRLGDAVMLVPADAHLAEFMDGAATAFENAHLNLDNLDEELARKWSWNIMGQASSRICAAW